MDFSSKCYLFCECNSVRIGQDIQNEVSLERFVFADVVAYQLFIFNWKLSGSREEFIPRSIWSYTTLAVRKGLSIITSKLYCMRNQMRFDGQRLFKASINIKKRFSCIGSFRVRQTELLSSNHFWRIGEIRQHQFWRKRAITRNPQRMRIPPFLSGERCCMWTPVSRLFYYNLYSFFVSAAIPPIGQIFVSACHITIRVDQFYCCQCAIRWDNKTAA